MCVSLNRVFMDSRYQGAKRSSRGLGDAETEQRSEDDFGRFRDQRSGAAETEVEKLTNGGESDEAEIGGFEESPILPERKQDGASRDVSDHNKKAE